MARKTPDRCCNPDENRVKADQRAFLRSFRRTPFARWFQLFNRTGDTRASRNRRRSEKPPETASGRSRRKIINSMEGKAKRESCPKQDCRPWPAPAFFLISAGPILQTPGVFSFAHLKLRTILLRNPPSREERFLTFSTGKTRSTCAGRAVPDAAIASSLAV
jgi:hypothetical protein